MILRQIFESVLLLKEHPRTMICIVVQVLGADGCILSCAINAVCLALMDAGN
jgi:ribonuclease PH